MAEEEEEFEKGVYNDNDMKTFIGIDNGVSGSISIITELGEVVYVKTPTKKQQNYTKKIQQITRIDGNKIFELFEPYLKDEVYVMMERPMVNQQYFYATQSALRALEATLIVLEKCNFKYEIIDSTTWQNVLLPEYLDGKLVEKETLKLASLEIGKKLYPNIDFTGFKDSDGLLIATYCRRKYT